MSRIKRALTQEELQLLNWLLEHGEPEAKKYMPQLAEVSVIGNCDCGCPTIDLAVSGKAATPGSGSTILADFQGTTPEGVYVGVLVHAREGLLSELEVYAFIDAKGFSFPKSETLEPWGFKRNA